MTWGSSETILNIYDASLRVILATKEDFPGKYIFRNMLSKAGRPTPPAYDFMAPAALPDTVDTIQRQHD